MSDQVYTLLEARDWFRDHPKGHIMCVNKEDLTQRYCKSYIEAKSFFWEELEAEERAMELIKNTPHRGWP